MSCLLLFKAITMFLITLCYITAYRILVDLPDAENRMKILRIILNRENLEPDFQFDKLANATEGYSGSDLKVMQ